MTEENERTFVMVKPDGMRRGLAGEVIARFERRGLRVAAMKMMRVPRALAEDHYAEHKGKTFYEKLVEFVTSAPVVAMVVEGPRAVRLVRSMIGNVNPEKADPGSIRADFTTSGTYNIVHAADSPESAKREIGLFFTDNEIFDW